MSREVHVCLANHDALGRSMLLDIMQWLAAGLEEVGILMSVSDGFRRGFPNIIFENHNAGYRDVLREHGKSINLICFVTEVIQQDKFDDAYGAWNGKDRFNGFMSIAEHYDGFITTVPANVPVLGKIAPATFFEFGFLPQLVSTLPVEQWEHDVSFAGGLGLYRLSVLEKIRKAVPVFVPGAGGVNHTALALSDDAYINLIRKSAMNLCLKQHPNWPLPSPTRLARIGHSGTGCALEKTAVTTRQSALFPTFDTVDDFVAKFASVDRQKIAQEAEQRAADYQRALPMRREIERNLAECPALAATASASG